MKVSQMKDLPYGYDPVACPVCDEDVMRKNAIKPHISKSAQGELWHKEIYDLKETPHLDFYKSHIDKKVVITFNF